MGSEEVKILYIVINLGGVGVNWICKNRSYLSDLREWSNCRHYMRSEIEYSLVCVGGMEVVESSSCRHSHLVSSYLRHFYTLVEERKNGAQ